MSDSAASSITVDPRHRLRLTLCLLVWNEIEGCGHDVPALPLEAFEEVYAVDGGSTDGTVEYLRARGIPVHPQPVRGYNQAYLHAFAKCTTDALVLFHPKGSIDPASVLQLRPLLEQGADLVIASRMIDGAVNEEDAQLFRPRKWFVLALGLLAALVWRRQGAIIWDVLHGMRAMRSDRFREIDLLPVGVSADLEMVVRSYRQGLKIVEVPVKENSRLVGQTHFKPLRTGLQLLGYLLKELGRPAR